VGQIAKIRGCYAVGIAGGIDKCRFVTGELGFDACIDHRAPDFAKQLEGACPKGIDVYFENVGGAVQQTVWPLLNDFPRIPVCGLIAQYNATRIVPCEGHEHADAAHPLGLLCARRQRPRRRSTAKQRDELAALHSIASSARARSDGGTSTPSDLAVLRLMTNSKMVGA